MSTESAYSYTKTQWQNGVTPINEGNLNKIEDGIATALSRGGGGLDIGAIIPFSGDINSIPDGFMLCDGSAISRTTYATLFSIIGTTYGDGDGSTTFNLPDLRGRTIVGVDTNDSSFNTLGEIGGEKTHTLTTQEMPKHKHFNGYKFNDGSGSSWSYRVTYGVKEGNTDGISDGETGGGQSHNNLQPYISINYIIKVSENSIVPQGANIVSTFSSSSTNGYSCNYINDLNSYSTSEIRIGTWIDGKPIYRKVYKITQIPSLNTVTSLDISSLNISRCIKLRGWTYSSSFGYIDMYFYNNDYNYAHLGSNSTIFYKRGYDASEIYFVIEYTKTTD